MTANKGLSLGEKSLLQAALRPQRSPGRQVQGHEAPFPPLRRVPFRCGEEQLRDPGRSSRAGPRAPQGGRGAARTEWPGGGITAQPRPAISLATATSTLGREEQEGESVQVATQRSGDVRRLSLVPKVTGRAAGPGTICVCPQRGCGASGVWRS